MKLFIILTFLLALSSGSHARQSIREGEQSGIPDRADVEQQMKNAGTKEGKEKKREVRENQEETDPVFYDSTTSPKDMEQRNNSDI